MLVLAALISDHVKAGHALRKLRSQGVPAEAIRTIARDVPAAREVGASVGGGSVAAILTGALAGALAGGMAGWMAAASAAPLGTPPAAAAASAVTTAVVGLVLGVALGAGLGWLLGRLVNRRLPAVYARGVEAGDLLLVVEVPEAQLRQAEELLRSYGARAIRAGAGRPSG